MPDRRESVRLFKLLKRKYARRALAGLGGLEADGRWHSMGRPVVYLASSEALAVLEVRVHLGSIVPDDAYVMLTVQTASSLIEVLPRGRWPRRWDATPFGVATQRIGDRWLMARVGAALRVPSVLSATDSNVLLNPAHPQARTCKVIASRSYEFDTRLF